MSAEATSEQKEMLTPTPLTSGQQLVDSPEYPFRLLQIRSQRGQYVFWPRNVPYPEQCLEEAPHYPLVESVMLARLRRGIVAFFEDPDIRPMYNRSRTMLNSRISGARYRRKMRGLDPLPTQRADLSTNPSASPSSPGSLAVSPEGKATATDSETAPSCPISDHDAPRLKNSALDQERDEDDDDDFFETDLHLRQRPLDAEATAASANKPDPEHRTAESPPPKRFRIEGKRGRVVEAVHLETVWLDLVREVPSMRKMFLPRYNQDGTRCWEQVYNEASFLQENCFPDILRQLSDEAKKATQRLTKRQASLLVDDLKHALEPDYPDRFENYMLWLVQAVMNHLGGA